MIRYISIQILIVVACLLIILLNIAAAWDIYHKEKSSESAKVDQFTLLNICFYDTLMGIYLAYITIKSLTFSDEYCTHDHSWRSGLQCNILGFIFTFSAHGSLLMISVTALTRSCKCLLNRSCSLRQIVKLSFVLHIINAVHSVMPILPISYIQDMFRAQMTFTDNPFMLNFEPEELARKYRVYFGNNIPLPNTYTMLDHLNNVSSTGEMFEPEELGYYSFSSLCIHNMYGSQTSLVGYKVGYMLCISTLLVVVTTAYISIVIHAHITSRNINQMAVNAPQNSNNDLSVKVMLMIGSQLVCWITIMILTIVYSSLTNLHAPQLLYELTAVVIFPVNSYLNPIFNSFMYKKILEQAYKLMKRFGTENEAVVAIELQAMPGARQPGNKPNTAE